MKYQLTEILELPNNSTIKQVVDRFCTTSEMLIDTLQNDFNHAEQAKLPYNYPLSKPDFAMDIRLMTFAGFLLAYELTNNDIFTINLNEFIHNKKLATPDVFFYILYVNKEILAKSEQLEFEEKFIVLLHKIDEISAFNPSWFEVNLEELKRLSENCNFNRLTTVNISKNNE